ncbi:MAG: hypothetical protein LBU88_10950 [Treponema sp.]|nr:hypothetical protein [Treponema sp.]
MAGLRWGIIASVVAFVISFGLGLISGNQALRIILTAFVFGFLFFGIGFGLKIIVNSFFPEFMFMEGKTEIEDGYGREKEQISIAIENSGEYAVPEMYRIPGETPELGNIEDLVSGAFSPRKEGLDSKPEEVYNNDISVPVFMESEEEAIALSTVKPAFTPSFGDDEGLGGLPDLDAFTLAFTGGPGVSTGTQERIVQEKSAAFFPAAEPEVHAVQQEEEPDRTQYKGNKPQQMDVNFDAKQIATGLRTLINKDK